jgi:D-alanyl-lipoteichoic acid acyltransferase DltB (MBOAT superfamily)
MLFNSIDFAVFLPVVFALYWLIPGDRVRLQNTLLLAASYFFYGWWDWRFLSLILVSTAADYLVGRALAAVNGAPGRKALLWASLLVNLGLLGFFKYANFFLENVVAAFSFFGAPINPGLLEIVLPVGISFYTFQTLSYTIDVYRRRITPTRDVIAFAAYVSFFPQLVAGPIERAAHLLPQFSARRVFDEAGAVDGLRQILWGLFKKIVVADGCAVYVDLVFADPGAHPGSGLALGALLFSVQIYGDFSGYSDIAIGTAKLFGLELHRNFAYPYFSRDIAEFWRRWHISLSTWFRDYLYIPLGGNRRGRGIQVRNTVLVFLVCGLWHGANWTFVFWGLLHAAYFLPLLLAGKNRRHLEIVAPGRRLPSPPDLGRMLGTFTLTTLAWIPFRADSLNQSMDYFARLFSASLWQAPRWEQEGLWATVAAVVFCLAVEWTGRQRAHGLAAFATAWPRAGRWALYYGLMIAVLAAAERPKTFLYFQF